MRLYQVALEQGKTREAADLTKSLVTKRVVTKQQIRRALMRLFWKFEDILLDVPYAG